MDINLYEVLLASAIAWGALRLEIAYRRHHARKHANRPIHLPSSDPRRVSSTTLKALSAESCSCGHSSKDYVSLTDGTRVCLVCHLEGVEVS